MADAHSHSHPAVSAQRTLALINVNIASTVRLLNEFSVNAENRLAQVRIRSSPCGRFTPLAMHGNCVLGGVMQSQQREVCPEHKARRHVDITYPAGGQVRAQRRRAEVVLGVLEARLASVDRSAWPQQSRSTGDDAADAVTSPEMAAGPASANGDVSAVVQAATDLISQGTGSVGVHDAVGAADSSETLNRIPPRTESLRT